MDLNTNSIGINSVNSSQLKTTLCEQPTYFITNQVGELAKPDFKKGIEGLSWQPLENTYGSSGNTLKDFIAGIGKFEPEQVRSVWSEYQVKLPNMKKFQQYLRQECVGGFDDKFLEHTVSGLEQNIDLDPFLPLFNRGFKISAGSMPATYETQNLRKGETKLLASLAYSITEDATQEETFFRKVYGVTLLEKPQ